MSNHTFNVEELSLMYYGGNKELLQKFKKIGEICAKDSILKNDPADYGKSRQELYEIMAKKTYRFHKLINYDEQSSEIALQQFPDQTVTFLSVKMFIPTIRYLGTEKQIEKWLPLALNFKIIGCYAQTELAHGSDVQGLLTTATYDHEREEFVLHSPSVLAAKWWIGDLGVTATHCVTHAQLIINGKNYGVQTFIAQIRDPDTFKSLPGITVGDIGPKYGYNTKDNGFLMFNNYRIPRENMLMRYAKVSKSGEFQKALNEKVAYATMMAVRTAILKACYSYLSIGLIIAVRYSLKRTQFKTEKNIERTIFDYQVQMDKIIPLIADCFAQAFGGQKCEWLTNENVRRVTEKMDFSLMQDLHALISSCKAVYTWNTHFGLERLRQCCGGHGYSVYSRFPSLITEFAPTCTYEGENTVLLLQCARYLLKAFSKASKGQPVNENVEYLVGINSTLNQKCFIERTTQLFCPDIIRRILRFNAAYQVQQAAYKLISSMSEKGISQKEAWDKYAGITLVDASIAHNNYWTLKTFIDQISHTSDEGVKNILAKLCCLFGIQRIQERTNSYFESGFMNGEQFQLILDAKELLLEQLKPDASSLVDCFQINDNAVFSALIYNDPYEKLFEWASKSNIINQPEVQKEIFDSYKHIRGKIPQPKF